MSRRGWSLAAIALAGLGAALVWGLAASAPLEALGDRARVRGLGLLALGLWLGSLSAGPLRRVLGRRGLGPAARALGLAAVAVAFGHAALALVTRRAPSLTSLIVEPSLRAGAGAVLTGVALGLSSFGAGRRLPGWSTLHAASHLGFGLAVLHAAGAPASDPRVLVAAVLGWGIGVGLRGLDAGRRAFAVRKPG